MATKSWGLSMSSDFNANGLTVSAVMQILNVTKSYVYRMIRNEELVVLQQRPIIIDPDSILNKIRKLYPFIVDRCFTSLDYHIKSVAMKAI
jgi:hypothetical protein